MFSILLIEDDEKISRFVELELIHEGYKVTKAFDGRNGLELALNENFNLVLLDILLPELNGLEVLRRIRKTSNIPVILLTARDAIPDKVTGLDMGADDYITKPFSIEELLARIRSTLRTSIKENILSCGKLEMDISRHSVTYEGAKINLTAKEFDLLKALLENKSIVMSRETLLDNIWGYEYIGDTNVVDVYIRYLRSKIDNVFNIKLINTVRGIGYSIDEE